MNTRQKSNTIKNYELLTKAYGNGYDTIGKNNHHFETKVTYISSGVIVLSFAFINGMNVHNEWLFITGNSLSALALIINLASYFIGNRMLRVDAELFFELRKIKNPSQMLVDDYVYNKGKDTNKKITNLNMCTLIVLTASMIFLTIFFTSNISKTMTTKESGVFNNEIETKGETTIPTISTDGTNISK